MVPIQQPPALDCFKLNFDGIVISNLGYGGSGGSLFALSYICNDASCMCVTLSMVTFVCDHLCNTCVNEVQKWGVCVSVLRACASAPSSLLMCGKNYIH